MAGSSNYDCAVEVREAIREAAAELAGALRSNPRPRLKQNGRRSQFAAGLFTALVAEEARRGVPNLLGKAKDVNALAARAWELADALDQADPLKGTPAAAGQDDDEEDGINVAEEEAYLERLHRGRK